VTRSSLKSLVAALPLTLAGCAGAAPAGAQPPAAVPAGRTAERPALIVLVTVDQLRPDYIDAWRDQMTGGLRRLATEGVFFARGVHDHALTETAPGHAATLSGRFPYSTGISSNGDGVNTMDAPLVGATGTGASPFRFRGTALADWMVAADPRTRVLSVSRKDRGAILPIGAGKHPVFWYAPSEGVFVTSTWYADTLPAWIRAFNAEDRVMRRYAGQTWSLLLDEAAYPEPDSVPLESAGDDFTFPHLLPADELRARNLIMGFPWMDDLTVDLALRGVVELGLGTGPQTDLLAVSLSSTDAVGHRFGPDSRELHDQVLRLDRTLGGFLDSLATLRGADRIAVVLTSDHGVTPIVGVASRFGDNRRAISVPRSAFDPAFAAVAPLVQRSGIPAEAFEFDNYTLSVDRSRAVGKERELTAIARAFAREARKVRGVMRADLIEDLTRADTVRDPIARRWLHQFRPGGTALVAITRERFATMREWNPAQHGSPHDDDARVPIIFWGAAFGSGRTEIEARVVDIAPTLAVLLGIEPLETLDGVALRSILPRPAP
jgi:predicted AlkP superfamily pyrophosphatase or phosphodiesterase